MKRILKICSLFAALFSTGIFAQTTGTLTFTFTTPKHTTGNYQTDGRYVLAAWIETGTGTFVKSKMRYVGSSTDDHLPTWGAAAGCTFPTAVTSGGCNTTDATSGATLTTFVSKSFTWDGKNVVGTANGSVVADGTYRVALQETWGHGAATTTRYFTFTKGAAIDSQTPTADANFTAITLKWTPTTLATNDVSASKNALQLFPNPTATKFSIKSAQTYKNITVYDEMGNEIKTFVKSETYNISDLKPGVYFVEITAENGKPVMEKLIKK
jgi:hypothetical protein